MKHFFLLPGTAAVVSNPGTAAGVANTTGPSPVELALTGQQCLYGPDYSISFSNFSKECSSRGGLSTELSTFVEGPGDLSLTQFCPTVNPFVDPNYVFACYPRVGVREALAAGNCTPLITRSPGASPVKENPGYFAECPAPKYDPTALVFCNVEAAPAENPLLFRCLEASPSNPANGTTPNTTHCPEAPSSITPATLNEVSAFTFFVGVGLGGLVVRLTAAHRAEQNHVERSRLNSAAENPAARRLRINFAVPRPLGDNHVDHDQYNSDSASAFFTQL